MKVAIHQPHYFPWPRYLHKILECDVFVYLDTVDFDKRFQNRNQVKGQLGPLWLTIPISAKSGHKIYETWIADPKIGRKHYGIIASNYAHAEGFSKWSAELRAFLYQFGTDFTKIAIDSTEWLLDKLDCRAQRIRASELEGVEGKKSSLNASICQTLGATEYLSGAGALAYLKMEDFDEIDCKVQVQTWQRLAYSQQHPQLGFIPDLSALDLVLNCPDKAAEYIRGAGQFERLAPLLPTSDNQIT